MNAEIERMIEKFSDDMGSAFAKEGIKKIIHRQIEIDSDIAYGFGTGLAISKEIKSQLQPEVPKEWCKHIKRNEGYGYKWKFTVNADILRFDDYLDICPVEGCHARRPE